MLIRHARPHRVEAAAGEAADPGLNELGEGQARRLADWLSDERIDALYSSPLRRAVETAKPLADALGLETIIEEGLAEYDRDQSFYIPLEELRASGDPRWAEMMADYWGAENVDQAGFSETVVTTFEALVQAHSGERVAAVCHGGVINVYLAHVLGTRDSMFFLPEYTGVSRVLASRDGVRSIRSINEAAHLRG